MKHPIWQSAITGSKYAFVVLLAVSPVLALGAANVREASLDVQARPLIAAVLASFGLWGLCILLFKDRGRAAIFSSLFVFLFLSYGHFYTAIGERIPFSNWILWIAILLVPYLVQRLGRGGGSRQKNIFSALNVIGIALVAQAVYGTIAYPLALRNATPVSALDFTPGIQAKPDVYYIIVDSYTRADTLKKLGFNNAAFIKELKRRGFYVGTCSTSNYLFTTLSLASSLNMDYLWNVFPEKGNNDADSTPIYKTLKENRVRSIFEGMGYQTVAFETGYAWTEWRDADLFLQPGYNRLTFPHLQPFEQLLLSGTAAWPLLSTDQQQRYRFSSYHPHFDRVHYVFDSLAGLPETAGPKFVFAHILLPHPPYVFNADGSMREPGRYVGKKPYAENVRATNTLLLDTLDEILENSPAPPIIIIQGDHGRWGSKSADKFTILNAYFLPDDGQQVLYPRISPVNTFRVIFNTYFGADFPILDDLQIITDIGRPYKNHPAPHIPSPCD
ncbi:MAG: hypothetical protein AB1846_02285 [Chloroflexota bacterium]